MPNPLSPALTRILGAVMGGAGVVGAISAWNKFPGYPDFSENIAALGEKQRELEDRTAGEFASAWGGFAAQQKANVEKGLAAQNISDPAVKQRAMQQTETALSGAYANARAALEQAKMTAGNQLAGASASYFQNLAKKQYQAAMGKFMAEQGIWSALGGLGAGLLNIPSSNKEAPGYATAGAVGPEAIYPASQTPEQLFTLPYNEALNYGNR